MDITFFAVLVTRLVEPGAVVEDRFERDNRAAALAYEELAARYADRNHSVSLYACRLDRPRLVKTTNL